MLLMYILWNLLANILFETVFYNRFQQSVHDILQIETVLKKYQNDWIKQDPSGLIFG